MWHGINSIAANGKIMAGITVLSLFDGMSCGRLALERAKQARKRGRQACG